MVESADGFKREEPEGQDFSTTEHEAGERSREEYRGCEVAITTLLEAAERAEQEGDYTGGVLGYYRAAVVVAVEADGRATTRDSVISHFLEKATDRPAMWRFELLELAEDGMWKYGTSTENAEHYVDIETRRGNLADRFTQKMIGRNLTADEIVTAARVYTNGPSKSAGDEDRHMFKEKAKAHGYGEYVLSTLDALFDGRDARWEADLF